MMRPLLMERVVSVIAVLGVAIGFAGNLALAQEPQRGETVTERARPELDALGVRMGGFILYPQLGLTEIYDSNIFAQNTGTIDDYITVISPSMQLRSDWNNHALNVYAKSDIGLYNDYDSENYADYLFGADGRIDASRNVSVNATIAYGQQHEDRGSPDDANGTEPTEFTTLSGELGYTHRFGRFNLQVGANTTRYDYDDATALPGPVIINHDDRDRDEREGVLRVGFEIVPGYEAFVRGTYYVRDYEQALDDNGFNRNSDGYELVAGAAIDLTGVTTGDVFVGYRAQDYDDIAFPSNKGFQYGGALTWNFSGLTTVRGSIVRTVEETTIGGSSGYFATQGALALDHELLRSLLLGAEVAYTDKDYDGIAITRNDDELEAGLYAKYLMNRHLYITGAYDYLRRNSSVIGQDYSKNVFMLRLQAQY